MSEFRFNSIVALDFPSTLQDGFFLWIWYADKIPPHIGCSTQGRYYSLKVNGKDENIHIEKVFLLIQNKKIPAVFVKLKREIDSSLLSEVYTRFSKAEITKNTCLTPITDLLNCPPNILQLSELLKYLTKCGEIDTVFGLNLNEDYIGIPDYNQSDIENRLRKLENAKSEKYTPSIG